MSRAEKVQAIYDELPELDCKGMCQESCGPIEMSDAEEERIIKRHGRRPGIDSTLTCTLLDRDSGKCSIYDDRPMICRLWGLVKKMRCPHGCEPKRWVTDQEARRLLSELDGIQRKSSAFK